MKFDFGQVAGWGLLFGIAQHACQKAHGADSTAAVGRGVEVGAGMVELVVLPGGAGIFADHHAIQKLLAGKSTYIFLAINASTTRLWT